MKSTSLFPLGIILIWFVVVLTNFAPGGWIFGWDNLHPEFSFVVNIKRSVFAVWQEYQGLGLLGGMAHAADLPRQVVLMLLSFVIPLNFLRQMYIFTMLLLGPLGVYFLLEKILIQKKLASFLGSVFYLLNLATIQTFYTAYEPFVTHFGFLPWLILVSLNYIIKPTFKNFVFFIIVNFFAIPQAYVPTTFFVYLLAFTATCLISVKKYIKILLLTLFINAFWLAPFIYFSFNNANVTIQAKINQMTTENIYMLNKSFGDLINVAVLKGFWFNYIDFSHDSHRFADLLLPWKEHFHNIFITGIGLLLFAIVLMGIVVSFRQKNRYRFFLLFLFLIPFTALANNAPPFSWIDNLIFKLPIISQALRSPFTKFSILAAFSYAIFFAFGIDLILNLFRGKIFKASMLIILGVAWVFLMLPAFKGHLFYKQIKLDIPRDYFAMWQFFNHQNPNTRIGYFPITTFWGWDFYSWGYSGSGFLWYGLKQPILARAFDVWSNHNENYFWEISYAMYSKNLTLFEKVLDKYQVNWLMLDESIVYPSSPKALFVDELKQLISLSDKITLAQNFGKIKIYQVEQTTKVSNFVFLAQNLPIVGPQYNWNNFDAAYLENGPYLNDPLPASYYPFRTLFSGKEQNDLEFSVEEKENYFIFRKEIPDGFSNYYLDISQIDEDDLMWVDPNDLSKTNNLSEDLFFDGKAVVVTVPQAGGLFSYEASADTISPILLENLLHKFGYLIAVESINLKGKPLTFWIENSTLRKADLEVYLPKSPQLTTSYFIQPPMEEDGLGYVLHFEQVNIGNQQAENKLGKIKVYPIPFYLLTSLVLRKEQTPALGKFTAVQVEHPNESIYFVDIADLKGHIWQDPVLVLSQAYDKGWKAYAGNFPFKNTELKKHVMVNNWENGWVLDNPTSKVTIFYLPQILEFLGIFLGISAIVVILILDK